MQPSSDVWTELALHFLTPRSLGLLECTCKTLQRVVAGDPRVWERQAVLAWNGFYSADLTNFRSESEQFLTRRMNTRVINWRSGVVVFVGGEWFHDTRVIVDGWCGWSEILCVLEMVGSGYFVYGYATEDPKKVTMHELEEGWGLDEFCQRAWIANLMGECWQELRDMNEECSEEGSSASDESY